MYTRFTHKLTIIFLLLCCAANTFACINEYRAGLHGKRVESDGIFQLSPSYDLSDTSWLREQLAFADSIWHATGNVEDHSDYGAKLVFNRRYREAKAVFIEIEKQRPGFYATSANLGTVYELLGNNDSALFWIRRAVEILPSSHDSSEWIHVRILEAKIAAAGDTNYFKTHRILPLDFGTYTRYYQYCVDTELAAAIILPVI